MYWRSSLEETIESVTRLNSAQVKQTDLEEWLKHYSEAAPTSSNSGSGDVPFQRWFHFKEAFSPKFVADTISSAPYQVNTCIDPFCGSGTTALTSRFIGVDSISIELNPFIADVAKAKVTPVSPLKLASAAEQIIREVSGESLKAPVTPVVPATFREPGVDGKWIFSADTFDVCILLNQKINEVSNRKVARLLRVLLGSVLVKSSNVVVNGKGRRYRSNWQGNQSTPSDLISAFEAAVALALDDMAKFDLDNNVSSKIYVGDTRKRLGQIKEADIAIFSPPYPNSFDYTDVYNIELWMLGYLSSYQQNSSLRRSTLRSHVQIKWPRLVRATDSSALNRVIEELREVSTKLWNKNIPEMIAHYFADLNRVFKHLNRILPENGLAVVAIGDSQYAGIHVDVAEILEEVVLPVGFRMVEMGAIRSMRNSSQHGGRLELSEHCLVFRKS